jgi:solute carrier family 29 (equilibrative nucleoside transporter), member 1/2/3
MDLVESPPTSDSINNSPRSQAHQQLPRSERFISSVFSLLGLGLLVPWNAFISAKPYFEARICSDTAVSGNIEVLISPVFTSSSVLSLFLMISYQSLRDRFFTEKARSAIETSTNPQTEINNQQSSDDPLITRSSNRNSAHTWYMVCVPLFIYFGVFLLLATLVFFPSIRASTFYIFMIGSLAICGIMVAVASAGVVAAANRFPPKVAIAHFFSGQAIGGVAVSGAKLAAAVFEDPLIYWDHECGNDLDSVIDATTCVPYKAVDWGSFVYFFLGSLVLAACIIGYNEIDKCQRKMNRSDYEPLQDVPEDVEVDSPRLTIDFPGNRADAKAKSDDESDGENSSSLAGPTAMVWKEVKGPATCIFFAFAVTLAIFPAWTSTLKSAHQCESNGPLSRLSNDLYTPATFVIFNLGDLTGRLLAERVPLDSIVGLSTKLVVFAISRGLFFGLFLFCTASKMAFHAVPSDIFSLLVQFTFALSNGYLVSIAFMHASNLISNTGAMQERSSEILNFSLSFGLLCGSLLSFCYTNFAAGGW